MVFLANLKFFLEKIEFFCSELINPSIRPCFTQDMYLSHFAEKGLLGLFSRKHDGLGRVTITSSIPNY